MNESTARLAHMMAILDQLIATVETDARRALVSTPADNDASRASLQDETDLVAMEWHAEHPRGAGDPYEILGSFITVEHPGQAEMFVQGFETFEAETAYQVYKDLCLILAPGSSLRFFDKCNARNVQNSVSGRRGDL